MDSSTASGTACEADRSHGAWNPWSGRFFRINPATPRAIGASKERWGMAKNVIIYTRDGWTSCKHEKEFLSHRGIAFTDRNIAEDPAALAELERMGYRATPVTVIDGEVVVGFDRGKIERLLELV
jgi:glutaredoxin